jgi:hypothetical protein
MATAKIECEPRGGKRGRLAVGGSAVTMDPAIGNMPSICRIGSGC